MDQLTDESFWDAHWDSRENEVSKPVSGKDKFVKLFLEIYQTAKYKNACELGGFPGTYVSYLNHALSIPTCLVDYVVKESLFNKVVEIEQANKNEVQIMQADIFTCDIPKQWDFVYSLGLLEHFENTTQVLSKHLDFTAENGTMMVLIPNFRGLNGWLQKTFDRENYDIHNIACMNINYLKSCCRDLPVSNLNVYYYGKSGVWLENKKPHSAFVKLMFKLASYSSKLLTTILPFESKFLSPYIVIVANKTTK